MSSAKSFFLRKHYSFCLCLFNFHFDFLVNTTFWFVEFCALCTERNQVTQHRAGFLPPGEGNREPCCPDSWTSSCLSSRFRLHGGDKVGISQGFKMTSSEQYWLYSQADISGQSQNGFDWRHQWSITAAQVVSAGAETGVWWQKCVNVYSKQLSVTGQWGGRRVSSFHKNTFLCFF